METMMCAQYQKEWLDTYLKVRMDAEKTGGYCEKMMLRHLRQEWLEARKEQQNEDVFYYYKVTGLKTLKSVFSALTIGFTETKELLLQIIGAVEEGKEYLLCDTDFVFSESYIFVGPDNYKLFFCYLPGYGVPLNKQLEAMFEFFLNRIDYSDRELVELLYDCYQLCTSEQASLERLKERLNRGGKEQGEKKINQSEVSMATINSQAEEDSYVGWIREKLPFGGWRNNRKQKSKQSEGEKKVREEKKTIRKEISLETEDERTMILSMRKKEEVKAQLLWEQTGEVIYLQKFPFFVGSHAEYTNFVCDKKGISRLHFCINEKMGHYFVSDLNSTNGTKVNGKELEVGDELRLIAGDVIRIGEEQFVFWGPEKQENYK